LLGEHVSGEFAVAVHRETEGNPFFVEEVLKALIERGSVRRESGKWRRCDMDQMLIPQSVKEAIGNRLDRVSLDCNEVLRVCAILGKVFTFEELSAAAEQSEDTLLDALDEAVNAQLIAAGAADSFSFTHDKIREVLYEELNPIRRRRLHRHVAEGLERIRGEGFCAVEKLAHHYIQAGDHQRGLEYAKRAAAEAVRVFAFDEAIAAYSRARDCAEALGLTEEQLALEEAIGKAFMLHGDTILAAEHFERALALATEPSTRVRLQCQAAASLVTNGDPRGSEYLREALEVLDPVTNPLETANALATDARFHHLAGRHKKAIELLLRADELVAPIAESDEVNSFAAAMISQTYAYLAGAHQHYGLYTDADRWARRAVEFGVKHNILFAQAAGYEFLGEDAVHTGDYEAALECAQREFEIAGRLHSRERQAWTHFYSAQSRVFLGQLKEAEQEFLEGIALAEAIGENRVLTLFRPNLAVAQAMQGRLDEALETATENLRNSSPRLLYSHFEALRCLAEVRFRRHELDEAERLCREADELVTPTESRVSQLWLGPLYIQVLLAAEKREEASDKLTAYKALVADCQSPRFTTEADRLASLV
jgi:tetratricopeptide (TPR) repeat protein